MESKEFYYDTLPTVFGPVSFVNGCNTNIKLGNEPFIDIIYKKSSIMGNVHYVSDLSKQENGSYVVYIPVPGVKKENINISVTENEVKINVTVDNDIASKLHINEKNVFKIQFKNIDPNKITANLELGILKLNLDSKDETKPKNIKIN